MTWHEYTLCMTLWSYDTLLTMKDIYIYMIYIIIWYDSMIWYNVWKWGIPYPLQGTTQKGVVTTIQWNWGYRIFRQTHMNIVHGYPSRNPLSYMHCILQLTIQTIQHTVLFVCCIISYLVQYSLLSTVLDNYSECNKHKYTIIAI